MLIVDDAIENVHAARELALSAPYIDYKAKDGQIYKRVSFTEIPGFRAAIEAQLGSVDMLMIGLRLNFNGELPNAAIHSDLGFGTHAAVLYLSEGEGGTAFWRHRASGASRFPPGDMALYDQVKDDWDDASKWDQIGLCEIKPGRMVIYESELFHSRWPFEAFGTDYESGRLVAVSFFTPRQQ